MKITLNSHKILLFTLIVIAGILSLYSQAHSQTWTAENQQNGFKLKKVVSDTTIAAGQTFSYTIYFTIPVGATNVKIQDNLPSSVEFLGHSVTGACGSPSVTAPAINSMGGLFEISWASVPGGCTGSFTVTVKFPNGVTCDGTAARNNVCMTGQKDEGFIDFCTPYVSTVAEASNPWKINKYPLDVAWQGGSCSYASGSDTITYKICVYKNAGTTGQLNLVNGIVRDTLPAGAVLVGSTCGATQSGNVITWNVGNMSATSAYNISCCQIDVHYPSGSFPSGTQITNSATLEGDLGSPNNICDSFTTSSQETCVELVSLTGGSVSKYVYTNRQPGCGGKYLIYVCNTGTTPISVSVTDTLPSALTGYNLGGASGGLSSSLSGGIVTLNGTLGAGDCAYQYVEFTIPLTATIGSTIENCAWLDIPGQPLKEICRSFTVAAPAAKPCLWKQICNKQPDYEPGDVFRYRLRIQNIGGQPITGATLTDMLDPNLEYAGNPSYYTSNSWNTPCTTSPSNSWTGVSLNYNSTTNNITASLPTIPAACQDIFYTNCGMYGTPNVPFYFIEFDVEVRDTAALGNVPNEFELSGGSLGSPYTSNTVHALITGVVGYNLEKGIKSPSTSSYSSSMTTTAGSSVNYQLQMNSSGTAALRHVTFADLLPRDDGTNDSQILQACAPRGSQFDITYNSFINSSPAITQYNNPAGALANVNIFSPAGSPGAAFTLGCGTAGTWNPSWSSGQMNLAAYFGSTAIGTSANVEFEGMTPSSAVVDELACNTFAASGWTKHLIQNSVPTFTLAGELESPEACVKIDKPQEPDPCLERINVKVKCDGVTPAGLKQYSMGISGVTACTPAILILNSPDGPFSPSTFNLTTSSWSISTSFINSTGSNPIKIHYVVICENKECRDSLMVDLPPCDGDPHGKDCCREFFHEIKETKLNWDVSGTVNLSTMLFAGPSPIKKFRATIVSAQLRNACRWWTGPWQRIFGDITGGNLVAAPAPGPQLLDIFSREAIWGPGECIDWRQGAQLKLDMIFPAFSNNFFCKDTLRFKIRYSFTDCDCKTCDTLVTYDVVRRWKWAPWGDAKPGFGRGRGGKNSEKGDETLAEQPTSTSLVMDDPNNGNLWVISPDKDENDFTVTGVEFRSTKIRLTDIMINDTRGIVQNDIGFINTDIIPGDKQPIELKFDNSEPLAQFPVTVRYAYTVEGSEDTYFTQPIEYTARVPGAAPDQMAVDSETEPDNVRSYALYFNATNGYEQDVSSIGIEPADNMRILAIGPPSVEGEDTYMVPRKVDEDSYIITTVNHGTRGVESGTMMQPVFVTVAGGDETGAEVKFTTYDENGDIISEGVVKLTNAISNISERLNKSEGPSIQSVVPNPANNSVTISYSTDHTIENAEMSIIDMQGREVLPVLENTALGYGSHIQVVDISGLTSGMYIITLKTPEGVVTKALSVVR